MARLVAKCALAALFTIGGTFAAEPGYFAGAMGGISTLSADGRSEFGNGVEATSLYKPENGPVVRLFAGMDLNNYFSLEGSYAWNSNDITMISLSTAADGTVSSYQQSRGSRQQGVMAEALVYFRDRKSRMRPYLSGGGGAVFVESAQTELISSSGVVTPPPAEFSAARAAWRTAVGIDVRVLPGLQLRYSFSETLQENDFSRYLSPPGQRHLANFQNLFGFVIRSR